MSSYLEQSRDLARRWDAARPRSRQTVTGWSGMADCRAYLGFILRGDWPTDEPDKIRAIFGTALHAWWTSVRRAELRRLGGPAAFGVPVCYGGVPGTLDEVLWPTQDGGRWEVTDWKYGTLGSTLLWNRDDFLNEMFIQPNGYAAGLLEPGARAYAQERVQPLEWSRYELDPGACIVRLLGMPVDAKSTDAWDCRERPFNRDVPDDALDRYADVADTLDTAQEWPPPGFRDKPAFFCDTWCEFFTLCRGGEEPRELELITDPELAAAVEAYGLAVEMITANQAVKKKLRPLIEGARGRTEGGFKVFHGRGAKAKLEFDDQAVEAALGARGVPLSDVQRWGPDGKPRLTVKRS